MSKVSVSILSNKYNAKDIVKCVNDSDADYIHLDIMDGNFVNNKTWNINEVIEILKGNKKELEVHFMVKDVIKYINEFSILNASYFIFHIEGNDIINTIKLIKSYNIKVGIAIKPNTMINEIYPYLKYIDEVLIMSVEPGKSGQEFMNSSLEKINTLKEKILTINDKIIVCVDGGINYETGKLCALAGADMLVSASFIHENIKDNISILKKI